MTKLECVVKAMDDKLATHIVAIDMQEASPIFDTFVLCTASNERLMQAIMQNIKDECEKNNFEIKSQNGYLLILMILYVTFLKLKNAKVII